MSVDKRSVHTDALATLGTIIDDTQARDAIHLAVEPVIAAHNMDPGAHVGLMDDGRASEIAEKHVGIVDPFLTDGVCAGDRFWLVVYPRQITSLRHVWEHPDFPASGETSAVVAAPSKTDSETWMRAWAMQHMSYDYYGDRGQFSEDEAYENAIQAGHNTHVGPYEDARDHINSEWWFHWESITGQQGDRDSYFSCAC